MLEMLDMLEQGAGGRGQGARSRSIALAVGILLPLAPCSLPLYGGELEGALLLQRYEKASKLQSIFLLFICLLA